MLDRGYMGYNFHVDTKFSVYSLGTCYLDIILTNFPFLEGFGAESETIGDEYRIELGGSALNFSRYCLALGGEPVFTGKIGDDWPGQRVLELMKDLGIKPAMVVDPNVHTNIGPQFVKP